MRVLIFGATGMIGQGVLRECLLDSKIEVVRAVGRAATGEQDPKLVETVHAGLFDCSVIENDLTGFDACFYCLGVTSAGLSEAEYTRLTYTLTVAVAETLARLNPAMTFVFVSGMGADSSEKGSLMWARVKGRAENAVLGMGFQTAYVMRPAFVQPMNGEQSRTAIYRILYRLTRPLLPVIRFVFPRYVTTTEEIGRAMISLASRGFSKRLLENADFAECAK